MEFLALITKTSEGYAGTIADVAVMAVDDSFEKVKQALSQGLALYIDEVPETLPVARCLADLPKDIQADYEDEELTELLLEPAPMNPVSLDLEKLIEHSGVSYRELARRMGTGHASISRITNPFYWGHNVETLRRVAKALDATLEIKLNKSVK